MFAWQNFDLTGLDDQSRLVRWQLMHVSDGLQYNTCFWALVKSGKSRAEAQKQLQVYF